MDEPKLRFPGFKEPWKPAKAGELFKNSRKKGREGLPIYSVTLDRGMVRRDSLGRQISSDAEDGANLLAQADDLAYNMMRMWQGAVGRAPEECMVSPAYVVLSPKNGTSSKFFEHRFKTRQMLGVLRSYSQGLTSDRLRLYFDDFAHIPIRFPTLTEQNKVASFLSTIDSKLEKYEEKLDHLRNYKRGVAEKIFRQEIRFKDENGKEFSSWKKIRFGELGDFIGGGTPDTDIPEFWDGGIPWISSSDVNDTLIRTFRVSRTISQNAVRQSATKIVPANSVLIVSRVGVGKVAVSSQEVCTSQDFTNFTPSHDDADFLAYRLQTWKTKLLSLSQGTSILGLTTGELKSLVIDLPCLAEQRKIAAFLGVIDAKIQKSEQQTDLLRLYKQGLLQYVFV